MSGKRLSDPKLRRWIDALGVDDLAEDLDEATTVTVATRSSKRVISLPAAVGLEALPRIDEDLVALGTIAVGGMGRVLLARQTSLSREVAVKTPKDDAVPDEIDALVREALVTGALEHPSIVPVHALGVDQDGQPLLVMRRVEGVSWRALLSDDTHPAWTTHLGAAADRLEANLTVLIAICRAIELAHARGILHRDVKPDNVMLGPFGEVYLVDWGLATACGSEEEGGVGTPAYMAPEMANGERVDETTDVYLLGATLHRVLTGRARHATGRVMDTILAASLSLPATYEASVPAPLAVLCNDACAASKSERPTSVRAFRERVVAFGRHRSALAICAVARDRLARLERLLDEAAAKSPSDLALAYRLATEARFGFAQTLAEFPEHDDARVGATESVEALVELELRQGHIDTAAAHVAEAPALATRLAPRLEAARQAFAAAARENVRLRTLDHELDPAIGTRARMTMLVLFLAVQVGLVIAFRRPNFEVAMTTRSLLVASVAMLLATGVAAVAFRRRVLTNAFSRRATSGLAVIQASVLVNQIVGDYRKLPIDQIAATDIVMVGLASGLFAVFLIPRVGYTVPVCVGALAATEAAPAYATTIFASSMCLCSVMGLWAVATQTRSKYG